MDLHRVHSAIIACLGMVFLMGLFGCSSQDEAKVKQTRSADLKVNSSLVTATNGFGFRLYRELAKSDAGKNLFISPTSLELALGMTYNGAAGATKDAMAATLGLQDMTREQINAANKELLALLKNPDSRVQLAIADALWGRQGITFHPDFIQRNKDNFAAEVRNIDFAAPTSADTINQWVSEQTRKKIPQLFTQQDIADALMVLVNALYFKGPWTMPFDKAQTQDGPFTGADNKQKTLPMMRNNAKYQYLATGTFQAISLPYGDKFVSMYIFLPKAGTSLATFTESLTAENWAKWMAQFREQEGTIVLPRFKAEYSSQDALKTALTTLGMGVAFDTEKANFADMVPPNTQLGGNIFISTIVHKTVLEVTEEGTEAAAVTGVGISTTSMPLDPFTMTVDRPFFFAIRDNPTGAILFMGSITDPK